MNLTIANCVLTALVFLSMKEFHNADSRPVETDKLKLTVYKIKGNPPQSDQETNESPRGQGTVRLRCKVVADDKAEPPAVPEETTPLSAGEKGATPLDSNTSSDQHAHMQHGEKNNSHQVPKISNMTLIDETFSNCTTEEEFGNASRILMAKFANVVFESNCSARSCLTVPDVKPHPLHPHVITGRYFCWVNRRTDGVELNGDQPSLEDVETLRQVDVQLEREWFELLGYGREETEELVVAVNKRDADPYISHMPSAHYSFAQYQVQLPKISNMTLIEETFSNCTTEKEFGDRSRMLVAKFDNVEFESNASASTTCLKVADQLPNHTHPHPHVVTGRYYCWDNRGHSIVLAYMLSVVCAILIVTLVLGCYIYVYAMVCRTKGRGRGGRGGQQTRRTPPGRGRGHDHCPYCPRPRMLERCPQTYEDIQLEDLSDREHAMLVAARNRLQQRCSRQAPRRSRLSSVMTLFRMR